MTLLKRISAIAAVSFAVRIVPLPLRGLSPEVAVEENVPSQAGSEFVAPEEPSFDSRIIEEENEDNETLNSDDVNASNEETSQTEMNVEFPQDDEVELIVIGSVGDECGPQISCLDDDEEDALFEGLADLEDGDYYVELMDDGDDCDADLDLLRLPGAARENPNFDLSNRFAALAA